MTNEEGQEYYNETAPMPARLCHPDMTDKATAWDKLAENNAEIKRLRAALLNIQALAERGFPIDHEKLAAQCRHAINKRQITMDHLEKVIRPIVEGQIRGFLKEHPVIIDAVDWYKPRKDKATTFTNSLSKRIVRDLTCPTVRARLEAALVEGCTATPSKPHMALQLYRHAARLALHLSGPRRTNGQSTRKEQ